MIRHAFACAMLLLAQSPALAQSEPVISTRTDPPDPRQAVLAEVATGFHHPVLVTNAGDNSDRLFVVEQSGLIKIISEEGVVLENPFLDISALVTPEALDAGYSEQGLLGLAFHPDYADNGLFYVNYTDTNGDTVIAHYVVSEDDPNRADPASAEIVLTIDQPFANHNGGHVAFGPDGYLYIGMGDGGGPGDPNENAENPSALLGKLLRIDVHEDGSYSIPEDNPANENTAFAPEVWDYGLRNPWRFSFDAATGDLYIGDVGQQNYEEINFRAAGRLGGVNWGWDAYEGLHAYEGGTDPDEIEFPVAAYSHNSGISVVGGYVYRGADLPDLEGVYLFADWGYGTIWALYRDAANAWQMVRFMQPEGMNISSFGLDEQGELYVVDYGGSIYKFQSAG